jgi:hypothetical protein
VGVVVEDARLKSELGDSKTIDVTMFHNPTTVTMMMMVIVVDIAAERSKSSKYEYRHCPR